MAPAPAPIVLEAPQDPRIESLSKAFEGLLLTVHQLSCREKDSQQRLKYANDEVNNPFSFSSSCYERGS